MLSITSYQHRLCTILAPSLLSLWSGLSNLLAPLLTPYLFVRLARHKELKTHLQERKGYTDLQRPHGKLIWFHGASVGEALCVLPVIKALKEQRPCVHILLTVSTVSAFKLLRAQDLPIFLQLAPLDVPSWCRRFIHHWHPQCAFFIESELWPNLLSYASKAHLSLYLLNGRISETSYKRWRLFQSLAARLLNFFTSISACDSSNALRFKQLGFHGKLCVENLKAIETPLSPDELSLKNKISSQLKGKDVFVAASINEGEFIQLCNVARTLLHQFPHLYIIFAPRHPQRISRELLAREGISTWSHDHMPHFNNNIYFVDHLGSMRILLAISTCVFMGNSLAAQPGGGHNPFEGAFLGRPMARGPFIWNFSDIYKAFQGSINFVATYHDLYLWLTKILSNPTYHKRAAHNIYRKAKTLRTSPGSVATNILRALECT